MTNDKIICEIIPLNRTMVELKSGITCTMEFPFLTLNRTMVELKFN